MMDYTILSVTGKSGTKQKYPSVQIIAMTGYPLKAQDQDQWAQEIVDWLQKPLNVELLAEAVKRALEE
jgi:DNA-binding NtrC family response regulator